MPKNLDPITTCLVFTATDSLPRVIGAAAAERLKMQPSTIDSKRALTMRLITDVVENPSAFVDENVQEQLRLTGMGFRILPRGMALGASGEEDAERVIAAARFLSVKVEPVTEQHGVDGDMVSVEVLESVVHLFVRGHITLQTAKMISDAMQPASVVHVLHLTAYSVIVEEIDIEAVMLVVDCVKRCELPVVVEVTDTHTKADGSRLGEDVLLLIAASDLAFVSANISFSLLPPARLHPRFKAVVRTVDVEQEVKSVLARFRQLDSSLLRLCKKHLPAACAEEAYLVLDQLLVVGKQDAEGDGRKLVCLAMSDGVATIELNDVATFNAQTPQLNRELVDCILEVQQLVERGDVRAVVLQGAGPHFCTGGWQPGTDSTSEESQRAALAETLVSIRLCQRIGTLIMSLPVPVIAAVHGKALGGGLALALAADFRVCTEDTIFNVANLPRGRNPMFLLSMSLPMTVGSANAMRLYLEDSQMSAQDSLAFGIVHATAPDTSAAKAAALQPARQHAGTTKAYHPSHTSTLCSRARAQAAREAWHYCCRVKADAALKASKVSSVHVAPVQDAPRKAVAGMSRLPKTPWVQRLESLDTETRIKVIREQIRTEAAHVGASTDFADKEEWGRAGLDSLSMVEMRNALQRELGEALQLSSTMLFDYPTLEGLVQYIDAGLFPKVEDSVEVQLPGGMPEPRGVVGFPGGQRGWDGGDTAGEDGLEKVV